MLRFIWILSFLLTENKFISGDLMTSILAPLEVFRRFVWNFFRLENEHLNNCGKFRAVRDISIAPIDSSDQTTILRMMDEYDGVANRLEAKNSKSLNVLEFVYSSNRQIHEAKPTKTEKVQRHRATATYPALQSFPARPHNRYTANAETIMMSACRHADFKLHFLALILTPRSIR